MPKIITSFLLLPLLAGCLTSTDMSSREYPVSALSAHAHADPRDRAAILAMAGDYNVTFDFTETVALSAGYTPKKHFLASGYESVRVIANTPDFISLQHILVVGKDRKIPIKHWRQDWHYQPHNVLTYLGDNTWKMHHVSARQARGKWSQNVYQVDDSPRYGALATWSHKNGISQWTPPASWRPLPRRDATKRDDYDVLEAVNRHTITPDGWVHEQDNTKLVFGDDAAHPKALVREIGVNTYRRTNVNFAAVAEQYWQASNAYWAGVRRQWGALEAKGKPFGLTLKGEPEPLYNALMGLADDVVQNKLSTKRALDKSAKVIANYTRGPKAQ